MQYVIDIFLREIPPDSAGRLHEVGLGACRLDVGCDRRRKAKEIFVELEHLCFEKIEQLR